MISDISESSASNNKTSTSISSVSKHCIQVHNRQRGNPLLKFIHSVPWEYADIEADYVLGDVSCALFLSLRYHNLNPEYIHERMDRLGSSFQLRILLVQVDLKDPHHSLNEISGICVLANFTLILAWSPEEAALYLETYKAFEHKPPDLIMEKSSPDNLSQIVDFLTSIKSVNKSDATILVSLFGA